MMVPATIRASQQGNGFCRMLLRIGLVCTLLAGPFSVSFAHVQKTAVTRILFNPNTGNIEVMHRVLVHDAEHAANLLFGERQSMLESAESRELFSSYVINRFAIDATVADGNTTGLQLRYVGSEIDGQFIWVYQEIAEIPDIESMSVVNAVLMDVWPDQQNLVNIEKSGQIYTLNFTSSDDTLSAEF